MAAARRKWPKKDKKSRQRRLFLFLSGVGLDVRYHIAHVLDIGVIVKGDAELLLDFHDDLHHVEGIHAETLKGGIGGDVVLIYAEGIGDDLSNLFKLHGLLPPKGL